MTESFRLGERAERTVRAKQGELATKMTWHAYQRGRDRVTGTRNQQCHRGVTKLVVLWFSVGATESLPSTTQSATTTQKTYFDTFSWLARTIYDISLLLRDYPGGSGKQLIFT